MAIRFFSISNIKRIHSAAGAPQASFGGNYLHDSLPAMAAAYLFHLASNHAFVDGNKRVATAVAIAFLRANQAEFRASLSELESLVLSVARGEAEKEHVIQFFQSNTSLPGSTK